jgi:carbonic anhydrase/acetyltransferase-like protein (isoleucine patch superfamily)
MLLEHEGKRPTIDESVYIAPTATVCGDVRIDRSSRVLFGAVLTAEGGPIIIGKHCIIMENAVIRGSGRHPTNIGSYVLVGPRAYLSGCEIEDYVFLATGSTVFNGAHIAERSEVRINAVVHLKTVLPPETTVPIGWIAVGDPPEILPPDQHDKIWSIQEKLDFPGEVFGLERSPPGEMIMRPLTIRYGKALLRHKRDRILERP